MTIFVGCENTFLASYNLHCIEWLKPNTNLQTLTKVVLPAPCIPFIPKKNGGGFSPFCRYAFLNSARRSKIKGMQYWDLSSTISALMIA